MFPENVTLGWAWVSCPPGGLCSWLPSTLWCVETASENPALPSPRAEGVSSMSLCPVVGNTSCEVTMPLQQPCPVTTPCSCLTAPEEPQFLGCGPELPSF